MFVFNLNRFRPSSFFNFTSPAINNDDGSLNQIISSVSLPTDDNFFEATEFSDRVIFDGSYSYQERAIVFDGEGGDDYFSIAAGTFNTLGSVRIHGGSGNDTILVGQIQGANASLNEIDGGDGDDHIVVHATDGRIGYFGNGVLPIFGGSGNDRIEIEGQAYNVLGPAINRVDGGSGFDTFVWNGLYDLNRGTNQTGADATNPAFPLEIGAANFERLLINARENGQPIILGADDVAAISNGSDFDRALIGLGQSGVGNTLFVSKGDQAALLDLAGWTSLGTTSWAAYSGYHVYQSGGALLVVEPALTAASALPATQVFIDSVAGSTLSLNSLFGPIDPGVAVTLTMADGQTATFVSWSASDNKLNIAANPPIDESPTITVNFQALDGAVTTRQITLRPLALSYGFQSLPTEATSVAIGDLNGDGLSDFFGAYRQADGSFVGVDGTAAGLGAHLGEASLSAGRRSRGNPVADLDNDGDLDVLGLGYGPSSLVTSQAHLFENDGTGVFGQSATFDAMDIRGYGETATFADFNNDGLTDIYIPYYFRDDPDGLTTVGSRFLINQGNLIFTDETQNWEVINRSGDLSLKGFDSRYDQNNMPESAQAFDFNRDGLIDLFVNSHLFINTGDSFLDANDILGLPVLFEEGAKFFDFNNDGYLDFITLNPIEGAFLYTFNPETMRFGAADLPFVGNYSEVVGLATGDLNGDGWDDVVIGTGDNESPHFFINENGQRFVEYSSNTLISWAASNSAVINDVNGDGRMDIVSAGNLGIRLGAGPPAASTIQVTVFGANGERNQHGRVIQLAATASGDERIFTRIVDGGSQYISQGEYTATFTDATTGSYVASVFLIDYPSGHPVKLSFVADSNKQYAVYAASGATGSRVVDLATNAIVAHDRTYALTLIDDALHLTVPGVVYVNGLGGNDSITLAAAVAGSWAGSIISGGDGDDTYIINSADPLITEAADAGIDTVETTISYTIGANIENLTLTGNDNINATGNEFANVLTGNAGNNLINGRAGDDDMSGGGGNDIYVVDSGGDSVTEVAGEGTDTVQATVSYTIATNIENLRLFGTDNIDGTGNALANTIEGNGGNNRLDGGAGTDYLLGYGGNDIYVVDSAGDVTGEAADEGTDTVHTTINHSLGANVENLRLFGTGNLNGTGNALANIIEGNAGNNRLDGGAGDDFLLGYGGNDIYVVDSTGDLIGEAANEGSDTVQATISYAIETNIENLRLFGSDNLNGTGNALANIIEGNSGNNLLDGGASDDYLLGYGGNDIYVVDSAGDRVREAANEGVDTVQATISYVVGANVEHLRLFGTDNLNGTGNALANIIEGNAGNNRLDGGAGDDFLLGYGGNDIYIIDSAGDRIGEASDEGSDTVQTSISHALGANVENLTLTGSDSIHANGNELANIIAGNSASNRLDGGAGDDLLMQSSGGSRDVIIGGQGTDTFELIGDNTVIERFTIYDRASAITAGFGSGLDAATMIVIVRETRPAPADGWGGGAIISELQSIEEIVIKTAGSGPTPTPLGSSGADPTASGDTIRIVGNFEGTGLAYNTITVDGGSGAETVDISGLESRHRLVFNSGGGTDTIVGSLRPQDIVNITDDSGSETPPIGVHNNSNQDASAADAALAATPADAILLSALLRDLRNGGPRGGAHLLAGLPDGTDPFAHFSASAITRRSANGALGVLGPETAKLALVPNDMIADATVETGLVPGTAIDPLDRTLALMRQDMAAFLPKSPADGRIVVSDTASQSMPWLAMPF